MRAGGARGSTGSATPAPGPPAASGTWLRSPLLCGLGARPAGGGPGLGRGGAGGLERRGGRPGVGARPGRERGQGPVYCLVNT